MLPFSKSFSLPRKYMATRFANNQSHKFLIHTLGITFLSSVKLNPVSKKRDIARTAINCRRKAESKVRESPARKPARGAATKSGVTYLFDFLLYQMTSLRIMHKVALYAKLKIVTNRANLQESLILFLEVICLRIKAGLSFKAEGMA